MADVFVSSIPVLGAIGAAVAAGIFSARARRAQSSAERTLDLEKRLASSKQEVYKPMVNLFRRILDSSGAGKNSPAADKATLETLSQFIAWVQIYGSDDAVRAVHRFMQASYSEPPATVMLRQYGEFLLAIRRDISHPDTDVTTVDLLGMRITDIYDELAHDLTLDEEVFYQKHAWSPPWGIP